MKGRISCGNSIVELREDMLEVRPLHRRYFTLGYGGPRYLNMLRNMRSCDTCQRVGKSSRRDELPLQPVRALQAFEKWAVDFIGPINPPDKHSKARYIITATDYLTRWDEAEATKIFYRHNC
jgi:hypothetical protein